MLLGLLLRGVVPGFAAISSATFVVAAAAVVRGRWWVLRIDRDDLDAALARSCRMVLAVPTPSPDGVRVQLALVHLSIRIRRRGRRAYELRFDGPWRAHRKAILVRSVVAKQFEPPLPRIRIRLRRTR